MATKPQTADDIEALAKTWTATATQRTYGSYGKFSKAIRLLASAGWNSRAIRDRLVQAGLHPEAQKDNLYHHITRLRRHEGI